MKLSRTRHDIESQPPLLIFAKALAINISLSVMSQCFSTDNVRALNKGNISVGELETEEWKFQIKRKKRI